MHDPKQERRPRGDTENGSQSVEWQTDARREEAQRDSRDIETDRRQPPADDLP